MARHKAQPNVSPPGYPLAAWSIDLHAYTSAVMGVLGLGRLKESLNDNFQVLGLGLVPKSLLLAL